MLYELVVYWKSGDNVFMVDTAWSKSKADLESLAQDRKANNPNYLTVIIDYKAISANIV